MVADEMSCPVCRDTIKEAFMAKCGHSFCYSCIMTHIGNPSVQQKNCPCCLCPLKETDVFPNFSLDKIIANSTTAKRQKTSTSTTILPLDTSSSNATPSISISSSVLDPVATAKSIYSQPISLAPSTTAPVAEVAAAVATSATALSASLSLEEIDAIMLRLAHRKRILERASQTERWGLLDAFLRAARGEKDHMLNTIKAALQRIDSDLDLVQTEMHKNTTSFAANASSSSSSMTAACQPTDTMSVTPSRRNVSGTLLPSIITPPEAWAAVAAVGVDADADTKGGACSGIDGKITLARKRTRDEMEAGDRPPLEVVNDQDPAPSAINTAHISAGTMHPPPPLVATPKKLKLQLERLRPHFDDFQECYFQLRSQPSSSSQYDSLSEFSKVLCRVSRVSGFRTLANIHYADKLLSGGSSIVSSIEFDKDDEFFATAGVTRKIKIFDYESVVSDYRRGDGSGIGDGGRSRNIKSGNDDNDASSIDDDNEDDDSGERDENVNDNDGHTSNYSRRRSPETDTDNVPRYPILEMGGRAKISCLSWNPYIKKHLCSSDYDGTVTLWDAAVGSAVIEFEEHEKRAWSVDFCTTDPTLIASGGDDSTVKIWSVTQKSSVTAIESKANVCSVKWNPSISHQLVFGSADHLVHYYDLRLPSKPLFILDGHRKAVSYVQFLSRSEIASASTDCTLRLWDVDDSSSSRSGGGSMAPPPPPNTLPVTPRPHISSPFDSVYNNLPATSNSNASLLSSPFSPVFGNNNNSSSSSSRSRSILSLSNRSLSRFLYGSPSSPATGVRGSIVGSPFPVTPGGVAPVVGTPVNNTTMSSRRRGPANSSSGDGGGAVAAAMTGRSAVANSIDVDEAPPPPTTTTTETTSTSAASGSRCRRVFSGHTNEKNFVGLSVNSTAEFIACGSETNAVYVYSSRLSRPVLVQNFGNPIDSLSGEEVPERDPNRFVSSVCWKRNTPNVLVAANSQGRIKVMELYSY